MRWLSQVLVSRSKLGLVLAFLLVGIAAYGLRYSGYDNTPDSFFMKEDSTLAIYERFKKTYGSDEYSFIVLESPSAWTPGYVDDLRNLTARIEKLKHVNRVTSIANARFYQGDSNQIDIGVFLKEGADFDLAARRQLAMTHPYYRDFLVSSDGKWSGILAETEVRKGEILYKIRLADSLRSLLAEERFARYQPRVIGAPVIDADVFRIINLESAIFGTISFLLVAVGFYVIFRSWLLAILPLGIASLSMLVGFSATALMGGKIGLLTPIMPSFLISVGVASSIFLISEVFYLRIEGHSMADSIKLGLKKSGTASLISVSTTICGLLGFSWSEIRPVQELGLSIAAGLAASFLFALLLIPFFLQRFFSGEVSEKLKKNIDKRLAVMGSMAQFVIDRWRFMLGVLVLLLVASAFGISQLRVDYYYIGLFKKSTELFRAYDHVDRSLRGAGSMELSIDNSASGEQSIQNPAFLRAVHTIQKDLEAQFTDLKLKTYSLANAVMEFNQAAHEGQAEYYRIPDDPRAVAEALFLIESGANAELKTLIDPDRSQMRVNIRLKYLPNSRYEPLFDYLQKRLQQAKLEPSLANTNIALTGVIPLWMRMTSYLAKTEAQAISFSALIVFAAMLLVFRSLKLAVMMLFCNLIPVAIALAVMGYLGIFLDPFTMLVSSIAIGILDDDTIHFVRSILNAYRSGDSMEAAIRKAFSHAGQSMVTLSLVLVAGFAIYMGSQVASLAKFGGLCALTIGIGALSEFLFTPAVLLFADRLGFLPKRKQPHAGSTSSSSKPVLAMKGFCIGAIALGGTAYSVSAAPDAKALFAKSIDLERTASWSALSAVIIRSGGKEKVKLGKVSNRLSGDGKTFQRRYRFTKPSDIAGITFLTHEKIGAPNDLWIFLPSLGKSRRILSGNRKDSFLGSEFSYAHLSVLDEQAFSHSFDPDTVIQGIAYRVVRSSLQDPKTSEDVGYKTQLTIIHPNESTIWSIRYLDTQDRLLKTQRIEDYRLAENGKRIPAKRTMTNAKNGNISILALEQVDLKTPLPEKNFLESALNE